LKNLKNIFLLCIFGGIRSVLSIENISFLLIALSNFQVQGNFIQELNLSRKALKIEWNVDEVMEL
jgi:hypothetical protein